MKPVNSESIGADESQKLFFYVVVIGCFAVRQLMTEQPVTAEHTAKCPSGQSMYTSLLHLQGLALLGLTQQISPARQEIYITTELPA